MDKKTIVLGAVSIIIIGSIVYLESIKPEIPVVANNGEIPIDIAIQNAAQEIDGTTSTTSSSAPDRIEAKSGKYDRAKEVVGPTGFINADDTFKIADLVGKKVILVDFWTYSCINCMRTTPYLNAWYQKYKDQGFEIVGIHTPEFDFEKSFDNVKAAVQREDITYPVVLDNDRGTWTAYRNQYWPHRYLIDIDGFIIYDQIGEGQYGAMEEHIQSALAERASALRSGQKISSGTVDPNLGADTPSSAAISPETYFGAARNQYLGNGAPGQIGLQTLTAPSGSLTPNSFYLGGLWSFTAEYAENMGAGKLIYLYRAKNVYVVASSEKGVKVKVLRDGKPLTAAQAGEDVTIANGESTVFIQEERLYKLIKGSAVTDHTIELEAETPGLQAFTFTFG